MRGDPARHPVEVDHQRRGVHHALVVDRRVGGDDADEVRLGQGRIEVDRGEIEVGKFGGVRVVVGDLGPELAEEADDLQRRRLAVSPTSASGTPI